MTSCGVEKSHCKNCRHQTDGYCRITKKSVDEMYHKWFSNRKSRVKRKYKDNFERFDREKFVELMGKYNDISSEINNKETIKFLNKLASVMSYWLYVDEEFFDEGWYDEV